MIFVSLLETGASVMKKWCAVLRVGTWDRYWANKPREIIPSSLAIPLGVLASQLRRESFGLCQDSQSILPLFLPGEEALYLVLVKKADGGRFGRVDGTASTYN